MKALVYCVLFLCLNFNLDADFKLYFRALKSKKKQGIRLEFLKTCFVFDTFSCFDIFSYKRLKRLVALPALIYKYNDFPC